MILWMPVIRPPHATCADSWISPPTRSRRTTLPTGTTTAGSSGPTGGACPKARCGRWTLQGRPGARCSPFDEPVSPSRPPNPACQSSRHRALHEARYQTNGCVRGSDPHYPASPGRDAGIHRRLLPCRHANAASLCPFAMCTPLACSDYYGHSATTRHHQRTTRLPAAPRRGGRRRVASHVHHHPVDEVGAQLYPGSLARGTPQPFPLASSPATTNRLRSRSPPPRRACTADRPTSARFGAGTSLTEPHTLVPRVHLLVLLAGPGPSGSADPSRRCQGCSHPCVRLHAQAALSFAGLLRQAGGGALPSPPGRGSASWRR